MRKTFIGVIVLSLAVILLSCGDDDSDGAKEYTLTVASTKHFVQIEDYLAAATNVKSNLTPATTPLYYVKKDGEQEWSKLHYPIVGFTHQEGYEYVIRVKMETIPYATADDACFVMPSATFLEEISKEKKDSERLPAEEGLFTVASEKTGDDALPYYVYHHITAKWVKCPPIEGFVHEQGNEYILEVRYKYNGAEAPQRYSFTKKKIIKQEERDSQGLPQ